MNFVAPELAGLADSGNLFSVLSTMQGEVYRELESRRTFRFEHEGRFYFAKLHFGVGWKEILKNLLQFRLPIVSASNEWVAIRHLEKIGVDTMKVVAFSSTGVNPATRKSCIVTAELPNTQSLEDVALAGNIPLVRKRRILRKVARITRRLHGSGLNHRDLYICHFHLALDTQDLADPQIHVIDLHRAQLRKRTPRRWIVKDVAGLYFSVFDTEVTPLDVLRFVRIYSDKPLRATLGRDAGFWRSIRARAHRLYRQENGRMPDPRWSP